MSDVMPRRLPGVRWLIGVTLGLVLATALAWIFGVDPNAIGATLAASAASVKTHRWTLLAIRWALWVVVWVRWERIGNWLVKGGNDAFVAVWKQRRPRIMVLIAFLEIVTVYSFLRF